MQVLRLMMSMSRRRCNISIVVFSNVKIQKKAVSPDLIIDSEEENVEEIDALNGYLFAVANGDYRLAVRMQFIRVLLYLI